MPIATGVPFDVPVDVAVAAGDPGDVVVGGLAGAPQAARVKPKTISTRRRMLFLSVKG
jgi:hypothetical protein